MFKGVHHVSYVVTDVSKVEEYMERTFGMKAERYKDQGDLEEKLGFKIAFYQAGSVILDFFEPVREDNVVARFLKEKGPGVLHVGWEVTDIDKVAAELLARGVSPRLDNGRPYPSPQGYRVVSIDAPDNPAGIWFHLAEGKMTLK